jgi:hypothetical protein
MTFLIGYTIISDEYQSTPSVATDFYEVGHMSQQPQEGSRAKKSWCKPTVSVGKHETDHGVSTNKQMRLLKGVMVGRLTDFLHPSDASNLPLDVVSRKKADPTILWLYQVLVFLVFVGRPRWRRSPKANKKSSRCLHVNTLLIEASPSNYKILEQTRAYDTTVNAALCDDHDDDDQYILLKDNPRNSGASRVVAVSQQLRQEAVTAQVPCTTLDKELDAMMLTSLVSSSPDNQQQTALSKSKLRLLFLVLDVEGHEPVAIRGLTKHTPQKVMMETEQLSLTDQDAVHEWATTQHNLGTGRACGDDTCYNFSGKNKQQQQLLLYGARHSVPADTYKTSEASQAYMYYGE